MDNYQNFNLNELKTILYINKNLQDDIKKEINDIIKNKIKLSNRPIGLLDSPPRIERNTLVMSDSTQMFESNTINVRDDNSTDEERSIYIESSNDTESESDKQNYKENIKKLYDRVNKKEENERFTQSSRKLYDRMFSEASYINDIGKYKINNISKPFADNNMNQPKLGERKRIIK
jgi:hypothetical protein